MDRKTVSGERRITAPAAMKRFPVQVRASFVRLPRRSAAA
jgi:hypothetical protein